MIDNCYTIINHNGIFLASDFMRWIEINVTSVMGKKKNSLGFYKVTFLLLSQLLEVDYLNPKLSFDTIYHITAVLITHSIKSQRLFFAFFLYLLINHYSFQSSSWQCDCLIKVQLYYAFIKLITTTSISERFRLEAIPSKLYAKKIL